MRINYERLFNVRIHNPQPSVDQHDVVKLLLVRILKFKHKNTLIYTEYNPDSPNSSYPDIYIKLKDWTYIYEIQKDTNKTWLKEIQEKYDKPKTQLIVVPLKDLSTDIVILRKQLEKFTI